MCELPASWTDRLIRSLARSETSSKTTNAMLGSLLAAICCSIARTRLGLRRGKAGVAPACGEAAGLGEPPQAAASTRATAKALVAEVALTGHHHRDPGRVGRSHHLGVAHRAAGLDDGRDAGL